MADLPAATPRRVVSALRRAGFEKVRQSGSHAILKKKSHPYLVTVPMHRKSLASGTLRSIIRDAELTVDAFVRLL